MATKTRRVKSMLVWKGNKISQERELPWSEIVQTFRECDSKQCHNPMRPILMQAAMHVSFCLNYAWEQDEWKRFGGNNWDELLEAMEARDERLGA